MALPRGVAETNLGACVFRVFSSVVFNLCHSRRLHERADFDAGFSSEPACNQERGVIHGLVIPPFPNPAICPATPYI